MTDICGWREEDGMESLELDGSPTPPTLVWVCTVYDGMSTAVSYRLPPGQPFGRVFQTGSAVICCIGTEPTRRNTVSYPLTVPGACPRFPLWKPYFFVASRSPTN